MEMLQTLLQTFVNTIWDVAPIVLLLVFFQYIVLRKSIRNLKRVLIGLFYIVSGLALFLVGLEQALFPLGEVMAKQLTDPEFIGKGITGIPAWTDYYWVYLFAAAIGFSTTVA